MARGADPDHTGDAEVHCFWTDRYVVTVHRGDCPAVAHVREWLDNHPLNAVASPQLVVVYLVIGGLVDSFFPVLSKFDDKIDALEDDILKAPTEAQLGELFDMKRSLMDMRKIVAPERDMIASINTGVTDVPGLTDEATRYFRDLYDHLIRVADQVDNYRDLLSSVMDTHLSTVSNRLNVVMKQLTIIATIFLPLSFLTGFFGQNFAFLVRWHQVGVDLLGVRRRGGARHRGGAGRGVPSPGLAGRPDRLNPGPTGAGRTAVRQGRPEDREDPDEQSGRPWGRSAVWAS